MRFGILFVYVFVSPFSIMEYKYWFVGRFIYIFLYKSITYMVYEKSKLFLLDCVES